MSSCLGAARDEFLTKGGCNALRALSGGLLEIYLFTRFRDSIRASGDLVHDRLCLKRFFLRPCAYGTVTSPPLGFFVGSATHAAMASNEFMISATLKLQCP